MAEGLPPWAAAIPLKVTLSATQAVLFHQNSCQATLRGQGRARQWLDYLRVTHGSPVNKKEAQHKDRGGGPAVTIAPAALLRKTQKHG